MESKTNMIYRFLGKTGMQVSAIGFGNMIYKTLTPEVEEACYKCITKAHEHGVNFFDTAESYGAGNAEIVLGKCLKRAGWARKDCVISTKLLVCGSGVNDGLLSRKHIIEGAMASLGRLQLDYVDIIFAHRYDYETPIEEVCRAFNWLIDQGKAFYWATSDWTAEQITEAHMCCERLGLMKPVADQVEYNLLVRQKMEQDFVPLFEKYGYGTTVWSPLAGGYLTGKYNDGKFPEGARYTCPDWPKHVMAVTNSRYIAGDEAKLYKRLGALKDLAKELKCSQPQLCLAWCLANRDVSTMIIGASKPEQIDDDMGALELVKRWTPDIDKKIDEIMLNLPKPLLNWRTWQSLPARRSVSVQYAAKQFHP